MKQDVITKLTNYQFEFELGEARQVKPEELLDGLNVLVKILDVDGKFEKLLREFENRVFLDKKEGKRFMDNYLKKVSSFSIILNCRVESYNFSSWFRNYIKWTSQFQNTKRLFF